MARLGCSSISFAMLHWDQQLSAYSHTNEVVPEEELDAILIAFLLLHQAVVRTPCACQCLVGLEVGLEVGLLVLLP